MTHYDGLYDMAPLTVRGGRTVAQTEAGDIIMFSNSLQHSCEGRDLNSDARRRQILSLVPSPQANAPTTPSRQQPPLSATERQPDYDQSYDTGSVPSVAVSASGGER